MKKTLLLVAVGLVLMLAAPAYAVNTNDAAYWEGQTEHTSKCYKHEADESATHGTIGPDDTVTLYAFNQSWWGDHWELLVIKYATHNDVIHHPSAGVPYVTGTGQDVSHWIVCKGITEDVTTTTTEPPTTTTTEPPTTTTTEPPTTTTTEPPTTTTSEPPTTTTEPPVTTTQPEETTTTVPVTVTTVDPCDENDPNWSEDTQSCELPVTGIETGWFALAGAILTATGLGVLAKTASRREN